MIASFGGNLPVTDSDLMIAKVVVLGVADVVAGRYVSSQCTYSLKQSCPFLIDGHSVAIDVHNPNLIARIKRTEFDGPDVAIECLQVIFRCSKLTPLVTVAQQCKRNVIILQTSCLKLVQIPHVGRN